MRQWSRGLVRLTIAALCLSSLPQRADASTVNFDSLATATVVTNQFQAHLAVVHAEVVDFCFFRGDGLGIDNLSFLVASASIPSSPPWWLFVTGFFLLALVKYARRRRAHINRSVCLADRTLHLQPDFGIARNFGAASAVDEGVVGAHFQPPDVCG